MSKSSYINEDRLKQLLETAVKTEGVFADLPEEWQTEEVQLSAVEMSGYNIQYINHSSEAVQIAAVKNTKDAYKHIELPCEKVKRYV
jgi:hypothetical protein